jgi:hypothetical protein
LFEGTHLGEFTIRILPNAEVLKERSSKSEVFGSQFEEKISSRKSIDKYLGQMIIVFTVNNKKYSAD